MSLSAETIQSLAKYDSATIANVIELFDVRRRNDGYMDARIRAAFPELPPMVGIAVTASFRSDFPDAGTDAYTALETQLKCMATLPGPAVMVFQDLDDPPVGATFGDVMCNVFQAFGSVGLITSGGGRDLAQVRTLDFPVFMNSSICSHAYSQTVDVGNLVRVGGLNVNTGDLLHGDGNGVTSIPIDLANEIVDVAEEFVDAEAIVIDYAKKPGEKSIAELIARRREMRAAIAALRQRVTRNSRGS